MSLGEYVCVSESNDCDGCASKDIIVGVIVDVITSELNYMLCLHFYYSIVLLVLLSPYNKILSVLYARILI